MIRSASSVLPVARENFGSLPIGPTVGAGFNLKLRTDLILLSLLPGRPRGTFSLWLAFRIFDCARPDDPPRLLFQFPGELAEIVHNQIQPRQNRTHRLVQRIENDLQLSRGGFEVRESFLEVVILPQLDGDILNVRKHLMGAYQGRVNSPPLRRDDFKIVTDDPKTL